jgi:hypothetical protein
MKNITVKYGVDSITKQVEDDFTFGDLQVSDAFKAALGSGDLVEGIEQESDTEIPAGATVRLETAATLSRQTMKFSCDQVFESETRRIDRAGKRFPKVRKPHRSKER